jgi:hypothetical protein
VLVSADVVGMPARPGAERLYVATGRGLRAADTGRAVGVLESKFAAVHGLPGRGTVTLSSGTAVRYVGPARSRSASGVLGRSGSCW